MWHKWISFKKTKYDSSGDPIAIGPIKYDTMSQPTNQINQFNQSTVQPKQATRQCFRNELRNQTNDWRPHCIPPRWDFLWIWTHSCCTSTLKSCQRHYTRHSVRSQSTHSTWVQAQNEISPGASEYRHSVWDESGKSRLELRRVQQNLFRSPSTVPRQDVQKKTRLSGVKRPAKWMLNLIAPAPW
jgi:hypothetical protein